MNQFKHDGNLFFFLCGLKECNNAQYKLFKILKVLSTFLGYNNQNKTMRPVPETLKLLLNLQILKNNIPLKRPLVMFAHYSIFVPKFSEKIGIAKHFPFLLNHA